MATQHAQAPLRPQGNRAYHVLMSCFGIVAALMFGGMALLVCADVLLRNTGMGSIQWSVEVTEYMIMAATFVAAPWLLYVGDHIRIDILVKAASARNRRRMEILTNVLGLVICAVLAWVSIDVTRDSAAQGGMVFKVLIFPEWWLNIPMVFCFIALTFEFARRLVRAIRSPREA
jgi:TRAP-type C4-dicarboxylate transport system permease small subunit